MQNPITRRDFIKMGMIGTAGMVLSPKLRAKSERVKTAQLLIPPLVESNRGQPIFLTMQTTPWSFNQINKPIVYGFNGQFLGPTVRVKNSSNAKVIYSNRLANEVSVNIHGLHLPSSLMGGVRNVLKQTQTWSPVLPIRQYHSTCYYHAATPGYESEQNYRGLVGLWYVEDEQSLQSDLPKTYGVDDIPLIIQDMKFNNSGELLFEPVPNEGFFGNQLSTNGVISPSFDVPRQLIRFRLLNYSNARQLQIKLSNQEVFYVIANEQGFLSHPVEVPSLFLSPGQRVEILIDMQKQEQVNLEVGQPLSFWGKVKQVFDDDDTLISSTLLTLNAKGEPPLIKKEVAAISLSTLIKPGDYVKNREFVLGNDPATINLAQWDPNRIDVYAKIGRWEKWTVSAKFAQTFTIQGALFLVNSVNGAPPLPENRGLSDTVWVDGTVELSVFFTQISSPQAPFLYGSRNLTLRDSGAVGQLVVESV